MADYHLSAKVISRGKGRSAIAAAAYRAGMLLTDEHTGLVHDYTRKGGIVHSEILLPKHAPESLRDRSQLWNAAGRAENQFNRKHATAQLAREIEIALPHELPREVQIRLARDFVLREFVRKGMAADLAIHEPNRAGDQRNVHAHILLTLRPIGPTGFSKDKPRTWNEPGQLEEWRAKWAEYQNRALERAGRLERVDHRSLEAQGIEREPEPKLGPSASKIERQGKESRIGEERREVRKRNRERDELRGESNIIDLSLHMAIRNGDGFEGWANQQRALQQNTRLEAVGEQGREQDRARDALESRLREFYGSIEKMQCRELKAATERLEAKRGLFGKAFYILTGARWKDTDRAEQLRWSLEDSARRKEGERAKLETRLRLERSALARGHLRQDQDLELSIDRTWIAWQHGRDRSQRENDTGRTTDKADREAFISEMRRMQAIRDRDDGPEQER